MFERLVERIARSRFAPNFVIKGGLLLSSMFGLDKRSTMDMDTSQIAGINDTYLELPIDRKEGS